MKVKMGIFSPERMAGNYERTLAALEAAGDPLARKMRLGKGLINAGGSALRGVDSAAERAIRGVVEPGGTLSGTAAQGLEHAMGVVRAHPRAAKMIGFGVPLGLAYQVGASQKLQPMFNDAIQEGRNVYANDKSFLEKKAAATEKTGAQWRVPEFPGINPLIRTGIDENGVARMAPNPSYPRVSAQIQPSPTTWQEGFAGAGSDGGSQFTQGLGRLLGGNIQTGLGTMGGGAMSGAMKAVGDIVGTTKGIFEPFMGTTGYRLNRALNPVTTRVKADELFAQSFIGNLGSESAKSLVGLLKDVAAKALTTVSQAPAHATMVETMRAADPVLSKADPDDLVNAYHTMSKFAPTLATDENAVRSFLREAVMAGAGPDYASIANLAKAETAVRGE